MSPVSEPEPLVDSHIIDDFDCGVSALDARLKRRALQNQSSGGSRTFVVQNEGTVIGYCALAAGAVGVEHAPGRFRRNMPYPVPVVLLGRLAVDRRYQGQGLGRDLMQNAGHRSLEAAQSIGIRGILVHAVSEEARAFYLALGFDPSPLDPMILMITLGDLRASPDRMSISRATLASCPVPA